MRLALSSEAAPAMPLTELLQSCGHRGLELVELVAGHAHGAAPGLDAGRLAELVWEVRANGVHVAGLYLDGDPLPDWDALAHLAAAFDAPAIVTPGAVAGASVRGVVTQFAERGATLLLAHGTDLPQVAALSDLVDAVGEGHLGLAWSIQPETDTLDDVPAILERAGERIRYIRFSGGGPESARNTGRGIGTLMARLTLAGYGGPLVLRPSSPSYHYIWRAWLGQAGGWGCGSKAADASLVSLDPIA
jgi:hypothetical protein